MADAISRFTGFASDYDRFRPTPPRELVELLRHWSGAPRPTVVDLGAGTGLATAIWSGAAASVIAVEPSPDMRATAQGRLAELPDAAAFAVRDGTAEDTGLPAGSADIVTASQAMRWFDDRLAIPEIARLLRPGGVFAAVDCDWPPSVSAEVDRVYEEFERRHRTAETERGLRPRSTDKQGHLGRLAGSGLFRYTKEICLHSRDSGDADRLLAVAGTQGSVVALLAEGVAENEIGLTQLREVAERTLPEPVPWWWTYRIRLAVR